MDPPTNPSMVTSSRKGSPPMLKRCSFVDHLRC
jgi:hypothetical protein